MSPDELVEQPARPVAAIRRLPFRVAAIQTVSGDDVAVNLAHAAPLIADAVRQGARLVVLPEYFGVFGAKATAKVIVREADGEGPQQAFLSKMAREHGVYVVGGSVPLACDDPGRVRSACLVYGPDGTRVARYDKIHLFAFSRGEERYDEGRTIEAGDTPVAIDLPCGRTALSICYDLRFPELYRALSARGAVVLTVPSAFTLATGKDHWEVLLRARAIENQAYVLAPAQGGRHPGDRLTYGHALIADPWGLVVARASEGEGVAVAEMDPSLLDRVRGRLPALKHRRL